MKRLPGKRMLLAATAVLFAAEVVAAAPSVRADDPRYTAQRKPRVTVLEFNDTNVSAEGQRYSDAVEAMLVTFLKRKSQLIVVERQQVGAVIDEWRRNQLGQTNLGGQNPAASELLEKVDAVILGKVTLLEAAVGVPDDQASDRGQSGRASAGPAAPTGPRIEIDVKLLSSEDGRIIAAAQRHGPAACLRSVVERLGVALEQQYLRPYYGQLQIRLSDPEYVRVFLTPILLETAQDEERPPVERSSSVILDYAKDFVEPWTTDPTTYTIEDILSGWYTMRLERPGFDGQGTDNRLWEARQHGEAVTVFRRAGTEALPLAGADPLERRFVVHVDPLAATVIDGEQMGFNLRRQTGSLSFLVKRSYLDQDYVTRPERVLVTGKTGIELNHLDFPEEYAVDRSCDLFEEIAPTPGPLGYQVTHVPPGQRFEVDTFKGGEIVIEDYQGELLPVGQYTVTLWEPFYEPYSPRLSVRDGELDKLFRASLSRKTKALVMKTTGARPAHQVTLSGALTGHRVKLPLSSGVPFVHPGLPVDQYTAATDIPGLEAWTADTDLMPMSDTPPIYDPGSSEVPPLRFADVAKEAEEALVNVGGQRDGEDQNGETQGGDTHSGEDREGTRPSVRVKTRLVVGGRVSVLADLPRASRETLYVDREIGEILDFLARPEPKDGEKGGWFRSLAGFFASRWRGDSPQPDSSAARARNPQAVPGTGQPAVGTPPAGEAVADAPPEPEPKPSPEEVERQLGRLAERLENTDLLILDGEAMERFASLPRAAGMIRAYIEGGGGVYAFISKPGDYGAVLGSPLLAVKGKRKNRRFHLTAGHVPGFRATTAGKKVRLGHRRRPPRLKDANTLPGWRVLAFARNRREPRILERGALDHGGYVLIWAEDPEAFGRLRRGTRTFTEILAAVELRALSWARLLMYRRFDTEGRERQKVEQTLVRPACPPSAGLQ